MEEQDSIESKMWVRVPLSPVNDLCAFVAAVKDRMGTVDRYRS